MTPHSASEFHRRRLRNEISFSSCVRARDSRKFSFSPPPSFLLWRRVKAHRRAPRSTAERRAPPRRERCLLPVTPDESRTPIIMQGLPKRPARTADYPKERAQRRARSRVAAATICRRFPRRACDSRKLQPALPVWKPPPINSVGNRVTNSLQSFALNAGRATNRTNRDFYVRSCVNNRPDKPKTLDRQAIFEVPVASIFASIFAAPRHLLATVLGRLGLRRGEFSARGRLQWPKS